MTTLFTSFQTCGWTTNLNGILTAATVLTLSHYCNGRNALIFSLSGTGELCTDWLNKAFLIASSVLFFHISPPSPLAFHSVPFRVFGNTSALNNSAFSSLDSAISTHLGFKVCVVCWLPGFIHHRGCLDLFWLNIATPATSLFSVVCWFFRSGFASF